MPIPILTFSPIRPQIPRKLSDNSIDSHVLGALQAFTQSQDQTQPIQIFAKIIKPLILNKNLHHFNKVHTRNQHLILQINKQTPNTTNKQTDTDLP